MPGTGYVSVADYLNANQGTLDRERGALQDYTGKEYGDAQGAADDLIKNAVPGSGDYTQMSGYAPAVDKINTAQQDQTGLQTYGGVADLLKRIYGGSQGGAEFDAGLLGPQQATQRAGLMDYLNGGLEMNTRAIPTPTGSGTSDSRHNRPHGPVTTPDPTQAPEPAPNPWYDDHPKGPEDGNPWWTEGSN
jgi:hypothetical protein